MKVEINKLPKSQVEITVEVSVEETQPYLVKAAVQLSEEIKLDGFRPGKAPYEVIKSKVGEMGILEAALDNIVAATYHQALEQNKIISIGQPKIDLEKIAPNNPLVYKATVAVLPQVKIGDITQISLQRQTPEVKDEEVDKIIADISRMRAKEVLVERPAATGDRLEINFEVFVDQVPIDGGRHEKYPITIGEGRFIPGFEEQLIGLSAGENKEFELKFPAEYHQKNLAGKPAAFKVVCNAVYQVELPTVDDEFAKNISGGKFATVAELKDNIKNNLLDEAKTKEERRLEVELLDRLAESSEFEALPDVLVEGEKHKMLHELEDSITSQGFAFDDYLLQLKKSKKDLELEFTPQAEKRVKTSIICREIYAEQKFTVTPDEVDKEVEELLAHYPDNPEVKAQLTGETYKDYLRNVLGNRKVIEYLKGVIIK